LSKKDQEIDDLKRKIEKMS